MRHLNDPGHISLQDLAERFPTEQSCRNYLEAIRWNGHITCPHCGSYKTHKYNGGRLYFCLSCCKQFTVTVGTIFEGSHIPLPKWFFAIFIITAHKKGISSLQLSRDIKVTQKTAWYMNHRIRYAIAHQFLNVRLNNTVEVDETYIGGKTRRLGDPPLTVGRGSERKTPVIGIAERNGNIISLPVRRITGKNIKRIVRQYVEVGANVMTDEFPSYNSLNHDYKHETVHHRSREYARGNVYTNTIEGFFGLLKRGLTGVYHSVSPKHVHRYCNEFSYRCNTRKVKDSERFVMALSQCEGRLTYRNLIGAKQNEKKQAEVHTQRVS